MKTTNFFASIALLVALAACNSEDPEPKPIQLNVADFSASVDENPAANFVIGTLTASASRGDLAFSITTQSPAGSIAIDAASGQITVASVSNFDFETNPVITATVQALSDDDQSEDISITLNVNNRPESVSLTNGTTISIDENSPNGTVLIQLAASTDAGDLDITTTGDTDVFTINNDGEIVVTDFTALDYENFTAIRTSTAGSHFSLTVKATNTLDATLFVESTFAINLNDIAGANEVAERMTAGQTLLQAYNANNALIDQILGMNYQGGRIAIFNTSNGTGLIMGSHVGESKVWSDANTLANASDLNGYTDWRLPTKAEVESFCSIENKLYLAAIWDFAWTSTPAQFPNTHWGFKLSATADNDCGLGFALMDTNTLFVVPVRSF